jgi:2-iminoacetate synthase ThiH
MQQAEGHGMLVRVAEPGRPAFQLRKGEQGISVFDTHAVEPRLRESEILAVFRSGSQTVERTREEIESKGLTIVTVLGAETLPERLRQSHAEIRPGSAMTRVQFKQALMELE